MGRSAGELTRRVTHVLVSKLRDGIASSTSGAAIHRCRGIFWYDGSRIAHTASKLAG
jgi:hypothetical protein